MCPGMGVTNLFKTVLVGNGMPLVDFPRGEQIDGHEVVVRFNRFHIRHNLELFTGKKTTIWVFGTPVIKLKNGHANPGDFFLETRPVGQRLCAVHWRLIGGHWRKYRDAALANGCEYLEEVTAREVWAFFGKWQPSTGALALAHFLKQGGCDIIGFSHFTNPKLHYADEMKAKLEIHSPEREKAWFDKWEKKGLVRRL